jgi:16S rRNA (adenine1518-N6/adenine1519-N6)-dimethyltransferase
VRFLGPSDIRELAERLGVRPSKRLGQNFVVDGGTVRRIASLAGLGPDDVALEVGPGFGSLTLALLPHARRVVAIEIDPVLAAELPVTVAARAPELASRLQVLTADAARVSGLSDLLVGGLPAGGQAPDVPRADVSPGELPGEPAVVLVANLPYNVAVPVVLHLLVQAPQIVRGIFMVQAEVAERMCAGPGSRIYGVPSAKLAWFARMRSAGAVPRSVFWPVPRVDSRLVAFERRDPPATSASRAEVFGVIDAAFAQRRKTLRAALAGWAGSARDAERILVAAGVDPGARGESLGVADFARVAEARQRSIDALLARGDTVLPGETPDPEGPEPPAGSRTIG